MFWDHSSEALEMFWSFLAQWQREPPWLCPLGLGHTNKTASVFWSVGPHEHHGLPHGVLFLWSRGRAGRAPTPQHSCTQPDASIFIPSPKKCRVQPSTYWRLLLREDRLRVLLWGLQGMWAQLMLVVMMMMAASMFILIIRRGIKSRPSSHLTLISRLVSFALIQQYFQNSTSEFFFLLFNCKLCSLSI